MTYEYMMQGTSLKDGKTYTTYCLAEGMSKDEEIQWAKEVGFDPATISITKRKL